MINQTNTTENGTTPDYIARAASDLGFTAEVRENMTLKDLVDNINNGTPTIVLVQAGNDTTGNWTKHTGDGRYMVVVGIDGENIYLEDPSILGSRGFIPLQEFLERWHELFVTNQTVNNTTEGNNTTAGSNLTVNNLGIVITGGEAVIRSPFLKID